MISLNVNEFQPSVFPDAAEHFSFSCELITELRPKSYRCPQGMTMVSIGCGNSGLDIFNTGVLSIFTRVRP